MIQTCKNCSKDFEITDEDLKFYEKVSPIFNGKKYIIPRPTLCPDCREQLRHSFYNEKTLYSNSCNLCNKKIVSMYKGNKYSVYCLECWWSEKWNAFEYGIDFDFNEKFFDQFNKLFFLVPKYQLSNDNHIKSINCEYTNNFGYGKDCYYVFTSWYQESCLYTWGAYHTNFSCDITETTDSELIYECINSDHLYKCVFLINSSYSKDCYFCFDISNCSNCLFSIGLRYKEYYVYNKPVSKDEYNEILNNLNLNKYSSYSKHKDDFLKFIEPFPRKNLIIMNSENCYGDNIYNSKNSYGYDLISAEDSRFISHVEKVKDSYDLTNTGNVELSYNCVTPDDSYASLFTVFSWKNVETIYCYDCHFCKNCFGCVGLNRKQYCILNKQYSKEEYEALIPKIIEHMVTTGEWGEFFPIKLSPFGYNETTAMDYFSLTREEAISKGFKWSDYEMPFPKAAKIIPANLLPDNIFEIPDDVLNWAIQCKITNKPFKIIKQELDFYRKMNLPIPKRHPDQRHKDRMVLRNPRKLFDRNCMKCNSEIKTTYSPERTEIIYCENCYLKEVY